MLLYKFFIVLTKLELKICILFTISLGITTLLRITTLKTSFLNNFEISFCLNADIESSAYLLANLLGLFDTILTCSRWISNCLWLYLAVENDASSIDRSTYIIIARIESIYTTNIYISSNIL